MAVCNMYLHSEVFIHPKVILATSLLSYPIFKYCPSIFSMTSSHISWVKHLLQCNVSI